MPKYELSNVLVRGGLMLVRVVIRAKSVLLGLLHLVGVVFRPLTRFLFGAIFVPIYQVLYSLKRRTSHWYRPAKSRLMFLLTNRYALHAAMVMIVAGTGVANLNMASVRAESIDAFNKSLLYSIVTHQESPLIEEYADAEPSGDSSYLGDSALDTTSTVTDETLALGTSSLAGGGSLAAPIMTSAAESIAPRESIETYVVQSGDTISTIAARFGVSVNTILWANNMTALTTLKLGTSLTILPTSGVVHTVKSGDTLIKIAALYNVTSEEISSYNKLADGTIAIGDKLIVPGGVVKAPEPTRTKVSVKTIFMTPPTTSSSSAGSSSTKMMWPSDGTYLVRGLSWYHNGLDIDCSGRANGTSDDDNYAAADGYVTIAGWRTGYGNLVEIDHGNGIVTRYGHNYALYVTAGQTVTRGTPIARCGSTGNSTGTHLHFEVRVNGQTVNPLEYVR
jgi:murein DD-endopeptidase MepM/ murein hydrolase activator NlpD